MALFNCLFLLSFAVIPLAATASAVPPVTIHPSQWILEFTSPNQTTLTLVCRGGQLTDKSIVAFSINGTVVYSSDKNETAPEVTVLNRTAIVTSKIDEGVIDAFCRIDGQESPKVTIPYFGPIMYLAPQWIEHFRIDEPLLVKCQMFIRPMFTDYVIDYWKDPYFTNKIATLTFKAGQPPVFSRPQLLDYLWVAPAANDSIQLIPKSSKAIGRYSCSISFTLANKSNVTNYALIDLNTNLLVTFAPQKYFLQTAPDTNVLNCRKRYHDDKPIREVVYQRQGDIIYNSTSGYTAKDVTVLNRTTSTISLSNLTSQGLVDINCAIDGTFSPTFTLPYLGHFYFNVTQVDSQQVHSTCSFTMVPTLPEFEVIFGFDDVYEAKVIRESFNTKDLPSINETHQYEYTYKREPRRMHTFWCSIRVPIYGPDKVTVTSNVWPKNGANSAAIPSVLLLLSSTIGALIAWMARI